MEIADHLSIPDEELFWTFARSSGPGGQNVNKVASKAMLRWCVSANTSLPPEVRERLLSQQRHRVTSAGELLLTCQQYRDQLRNRQSCLNKLQALVLQAASRPKMRRPTKPTPGSRQARLRAKRHRSSLKTTRRTPPEDRSVD